MENAIYASSRKNNLLLLSLTAKCELATNGKKSIFATLDSASSSSQLMLRPSILFWKANFLSNKTAS